MIITLIIHGVSFRCVTQWKLLGNHPKFRRDTIDKKVLIQTVEIETALKYIFYWWDYVNFRSGFVNSDERMKKYNSLWTWHLVIFIFRFPRVDCINIKCDHSAGICLKLVFMVLILDLVKYSPRHIDFLQKYLL